MIEHRLAQVAQHGGGEAGIEIVAAEAHDRDQHRAQSESADDLAEQGSVAADQPQVDDEFEREGQQRIEGHLDQEAEGNDRSILAIGGDEAPQVPEVRPKSVSARGAACRGAGR